MIFPLAFRLAGALVELELSSRWPISKNDSINLPNSIGFSGFNLRF